MPTPESAGESTQTDVTKSAQILYPSTQANITRPGHRARKLLLQSRACMAEVTETSCMLEDSLTDRSFTAGRGGEALRKEEVNVVATHPAPL